jgi:putative transposase
MRTYADLFTPNLFFLTNHTVGGEAVLANEMIMRVLRSVLTAVQKQHRFRLVGYVFLPNHTHLLVAPAGRVVLDQVVAAVHQHFQADYQQIHGIPGDMLLWEKQYQAHRVTDVDGLAYRLDAIHYDPVHHRLVDKPELWPYSSYNGWLAQGLYPAAWGWSAPAHLAEKGWR